jgi:HEPN domain-containing protein
MVEEETGQRVFQQTMDLWINPEIKRRKDTGSLSPDFMMRSAQIIFPVNRPLTVRLNGEVKAILSSKAKRNIQKDEVVYEADIDSIEEVSLTEEDKDCGHITIILFKSRWVIAFDFNYIEKLPLRKRILEHVEVAKEFLDSARDNLRSNRLNPFYEECFAVAELSTKAILINFVDEQNLRHHKSKQREIRNLANLGKIKMEFSDILKELYDLRESTRYVTGDSPKGKAPQTYLKLVEEMLDFAELIHVTPVSS